MLRRFDAIRILPALIDFNRGEKVPPSEEITMKSLSRRLLGTAVAVALIATATSPVRAQTDAAANYPNKPIRLIVPFAAGGGNDIFARLVTAKASEFLGHQFVIENRPAAGGRVAAEFAANQAGDGYTLFIGASGVMSISAAIYPKLAYHPTKSFIPLSMIADFPLIMTSPIDIAPKTVADVVAYAKANPDKSNYGTTSPAFTIATELAEAQDRDAGRRHSAQEQRRDGALRDPAAIA